MGLHHGILRTTVHASAHNLEHSLGNVSECVATICITHTYSFCRGVFFSVFFHFEYFRLLFHLLLFVCALLFGENQYLKTSQFTNGNCKIIMMMNKNVK